MEAPIQNRRRVHVSVRHAAYLDMLYAAIEGVVAPPEMTAQSLNLLTLWDRSRKGKCVHSSPLPPSLIFSQSGLESTGILAGRSVVDGDLTVCSVERAFPVSAWRTDNSVGHSCRSPELLDELAAALDLPWEVVGGYHSHPLGEVGVSEIEHEARYMPSTADTKGGPIFWGREIDLVVSVTKAGNTKPAPVPRPGPIFQTCIGEFEFWFVAYRHGNDDLVLEIETRPEPRSKAVGNWQRRPPPPF